MRVITIKMGEVMAKSKTRFGKKVIALLKKRNKSASSNNTEELRLVPMHKDDEKFDEELPRLASIDDPRDPGDLAPFETYIADLSQLAHITQAIEALNAVQEEELNKRITHYPPSHRLH